MAAGQESGGVVVNDGQKSEIVGVRYDEEEEAKT